MGPRIITLFVIVIKSDNVIELFAKLAAEIDNITFWFVECGFLDRRFVVMQKVSKKFRLNNVQDKYVSLDLWTEDRFYFFIYSQQ